MIFNGEDQLAVTMKMHSGKKFAEAFTAWIERRIFENLAVDPEMVAAAEEDERRVLHGDPDAVMPLGAIYVRR